MSNRLDKEKEKELQPKRMEYAISKIRNELGYELTFIDETRIEFIFKGNVIKFFPYSGWHTGKSIKDGRGIENLLKQLK